MKRQTRVRVVAAVIEQAGRVLIARKRQGDRLGGKWEFPGGKIDEGESPEAALKRELLEELGIDADIGDFFCSSHYDYRHISVDLLTYRVRHFSGEMTAHVHDELKWVVPVDLRNYDFPEANLKIIRVLTSYRTPGDTSREDSA